MSLLLPLELSRVQMCVNVIVTLKESRRAGVSDQLSFCVELIALWNTSMGRNPIDDF